jgi:hypothetical protein
MSFMAVPEHERVERIGRKVEGDSLDHHWVAFEYLLWTRGDVVEVASSIVRVGKLQQ